MDFKDFKTNDQGLIPCIVQDVNTKEVLMLAYMNEEAYKQTLARKQMTYFSRSRQTLWTKGETSGNTQALVNLTYDCDEDTLLAQVVQTGVACHTGRKSCFYRSIVEKEGQVDASIFEAVYAIVKDRQENPKEGSYTNYLFDKGIDKILKKVGEENAEIIIGAKNEGIDEMVYEIGDLIYHLTVLMVEKGATWQDIYKELDKRR